MVNIKTFYAKAIIPVVTGFL